MHDPFDPLGDLRALNVQLRRFELHHGETPERRAEYESLDAPPDARAGSRNWADERASLDWEFELSRQARQRRANWSVWVTACAALSALALLTDDGEDVTPALMRRHMDSAVRELRADSGELANEIERALEIATREHSSAQPPAAQPRR